MNPYSPIGEIPVNNIPQANLPTINGRKPYISTETNQSTTQEGKVHEKKQEQQILDYYSATDKYIRNKTHSNAHQTVFTKENDKYQWLVLEQKSQCEVEVRQTNSHGTITARDNYELTRNLPKCVGVERLGKGANFQIPFNADKINLIYQFGEQNKAETCAEQTATFYTRDKAVIRQLLKAKGGQHRAEGTGKADDDC